MGVFSSLLKKAQDYIDNNTVVDTSVIGDDTLGAIAVAKYDGAKQVLVHHFADGSITLSYGRDDKQILPRLFYTYVDNQQYTDDDIEKINRRLITLSKTAPTSNVLARVLNDSGYFKSTWLPIDVTSDSKTKKQAPARNVKSYDTLGASFNVLYKSPTKPFMIHVFTGGLLAISKGDGVKLAFTKIRDYTDVTKNIDDKTLTKLEDTCQLSTSSADLARDVKKLGMFKFGFVIVPSKPKYNGATLAVYSINGDLNAKPDSTYIIRKVNNDNVFDLVTERDPTTILNHNKLIDTNNLTSYAKLKNIIGSAATAKELATKINEVNSLYIKGWLPL